MKRLFVIILSLSLLFCISCKKEASSTSSDAPVTLTVYCYDSFGGEWGPGNSIVSAFYDETGIKVDLITSGASADMYNRILYEGASCPADLAIGFEDAQNIDGSLFVPYSGDSGVNYASGLSVKDGVLFPFDYGVFAFVTNSGTSLPLPSSLSDLTEDIYKDKVVLIDPRTSSVGLGLLLWTVDVLGEEGALSWWETMRSNALTIADSWSAAYGLFTEGEAPLVISYSTSPVYHIINEDRDDIIALEFAQGHHKTVEYAGVLASSKNKDAAFKFLSYLLTKAQSTVAEVNSMYPANADTVLNPAFEATPVPSFLFDSAYSAEYCKSLLAKWAELMVL